MAALVDSEMCSRVPVIVILGATGSGKSKLGIEIARRFFGEIISADSMQAYKGLDIITNKVTLEEQAQAPHHLLDVVTPPRPFSVVEFRDAAVPIVDRLLKEKKPPVVVGGTNYYIESLLWKVLVTGCTLDTLPDGDSESPALACDSSVATDARGDDVDDSRDTGGSRAENDSTGEVEGREGGGGNESAAGDRDGVGEPDRKRPRLDDSLESLPSPELHRRLQEVDPEMARRLHPNNRRRIIRSLQVFEQFGKQHSAIIREQRESEGGGPLGGPLRYQHSAIFWLQCDQATLDERLDRRVDDMLQRGLVTELLDFHEHYNAHRLAKNMEKDYSKGIFQSIGFKEFHEYLLLTEEERQSDRGTRLFQSAVEALKTVTRRYARKQVRWITNRFLRQPERQVPNVYAFDTSDPSKWDEMVYKPAVHVVECLMKGEKSTIVKPLPVEEPLSNEPTSFHCDTCDRVFIGSLQWEAHISSKKHKKVLRKKAKEKLKESAPANSEQVEKSETPNSVSDEHKADNQQVHEPELS